MRGISMVLLVILIVIGGFGYLANEAIDINQRLKEKEIQIQELQRLLEQYKTMINDLNRQVEEKQIDLDELQKKLSELQEVYAQTLAALDTLKNQHNDTEVTYTKTLETLKNTEQELSQAQSELAACQAGQKDGKTDEIQYEQLLQHLIQVEKDLDACNDALPTSQEPSEPLSQEKPKNLPVETSQPEAKGLAPKGILAAIMIGFPVAVMTLYVVRVKALVPKELPQSTKQTTRQHPNQGQVTVKMGRQAYQSYLEYLRNSKK